MQVQIVNITPHAKKAMDYISDKQGRVTHKDVYFIGLSAILKDIGIKADVGCTPESSLNKLVKEIDNE